MMLRTIKINDSSIVHFDKAALSYIFPRLGNAAAEEALLKKIAAAILAQCPEDNMRLVYIPAVLKVAADKEQYEVIYVAGNTCDKVTIGCDKVTDNINAQHIIINQNFSDLGAFQTHADTYSNHIKKWLADFKDQVEQQIFSAPTPPGVQPIEEAVYIEQPSDLTKVTEKNIHQRSAALEKRLNLPKATFNCLLNTGDTLATTTNQKYEKLVVATLSPFEQQIKALKEIADQSPSEISAQWQQHRKDYIKNQISAIENTYQTLKKTLQNQIEQQKKTDIERIQYVKKETLALLTQGQPIDNLTFIKETIINTLYENAILFYNQSWDKIKPSATAIASRKNLIAKINKIFGDIINVDEHGYYNSWQQTYNNLQSVSLEQLAKHIQQLLNHKEASPSLYESLHNANTIIKKHLDLDTYVLNFSYLGYFTGINTDIEKQANEKQRYLKGRFEANKALLETQLTAEPTLEPELISAIQQEVGTLPIIQNDIAAYQLLLQGISCLTQQYNSYHDLVKMANAAHNTCQTTLQAAANDLVSCEPVAVRQQLNALITQQQQALQTVKQQLDKKVEENKKPIGAINLFLDHCKKQLAPENITSKILGLSTHKINNATNTIKETITALDPIQQQTQHIINLLQNLQTLPSVCANSVTQTATFKLALKADQKMENAFIRLKQVDNQFAEAIQATNQRFDEINCPASCPALLAHYHQLKKQTIQQIRIQQQQHYTYLIYQFISNALLNNLHNFKGKGRSNVIINNKRMHIPEIILDLIEQSKQLTDVANDPQALATELKKLLNGITAWVKQNPQHLKALPLTARSFVVTLNDLATHIAVQPITYTNLYDLAKYSLGGVSAITKDHYHGIQPLRVAPDLPNNTTPRIQNEPVQSFIPNRENTLAASGGTSRPWKQIVLGTGAGILIGVGLAGAAALAITFTPGLFATLGMIAAIGVVSAPPVVCTVLAFVISTVSAARKAKKKKGVAIAEPLTPPTSPIYPSSNSIPIQRVPSTDALCSSVLTNPQRYSSLPNIATRSQESLETRAASFHLNDNKGEPTSPIDIINVDFSANKTILFANTEVHPNSQPETIVSQMTMSPQT